ncbi:MFS transporter [Terricaulis silvestris]|uniref:Spectinomycin tetracycline efflux pump n=1 Tax=Terricaulis silvestris TaxID=2686094 RepID=A0A6I6MKD7_9CAUL|nr:MFS transporter [Terricaulis silvestris]QGZ93678.1 Spectinomycin tetracycline efflux pump [Terricaulis silvestris]
MTALAVGTPNGLAAPRRHWAALAVGLAVTVSVLDGAMIHIAAPVIARDLGVNPGTAIWIVSSYQLAAAIALLPIGKLADVLGRRRVYLTCLALFVAGACISAIAPTLDTLAAARFAQGLGGAGILGVTNAILRDIYPRDRLARGIGLNSFVVAIAIASGPMIASLLMAAGSWRMLFLVAVPVGALLLVIGALALPPANRTTERIDFWSFPLSAAAFGTALTTINNLAHGGAVLWCIAGGLASFAAFAALLVRQRKAIAPLLPTDLLRIRAYATAVATMFAASIAQLIGYLATPFLLQRDAPRDLLEVGFIFTCWPIAVAAASPFASRVPGVPPRVACGLGLVIFACGLAALALSPAQASTFDLCWRMALCGAGYGFFQPANSAALASSVPIARAGSAGSLAACGRVVGQACGAAIAAFLFRWNAHDGIAAALSVAAIAALGAAAISGMRD